jgi:hypothetical protein
MTPLNPATFWLVAQCLNHCITACPSFVVPSESIAVNKVTVTMSVIKVVEAVDAKYYGK